MKSKASLRAFLLGSTLLAGQSAHAATRTWSNASGGDFNTGTNWGGTVPVAADLGLFNIALSANVTLSAPATPGSLNFDTNASTFTLGTLLGNSLTFANNGNLSVLSTLAGTSKTFTVNAPIVLTPASTTTAGAFTIQNDATAASNTLVVAGGISSSTTSNTETLTLAGANTGNNTISGAIINGNATTFAVTKSGAGTWILTGNNTYSGLTKVTAGTLVLNGTNSSATGTTQVGTGNDGTLSLGTGTNNGLAGGTITFQNGYIQSSDSNARTISNSIAVATSASNIKTAGTGDLAFTGTANTALNGATLFYILTPINVSFAQSFINGTGTGLKKAQVGTLILTGASTYTGTTEINGGTLSVGSIGTTASTSSNIGAGSSTLLFSGGTLLYTGASAVSDRAFTINAGSTATINTTNDLTLAGAAASSTGGALTKTGNGTLTLTGASAYTGATTVSAGVLKLGNANGLGFGGVQTTSTGTSTVSAGATLDLNGQSIVNEPITLNGTGVGSNGALVNNSATAASIGNGIAGLAVAATGSGSGYSTAPTVAISGTGSAATATASLGVTAASITSLTSGGSGWVVGNTFTVNGGGTGALFTVASVSSGAIATYTLTNAGTGYTTAPTTLTKVGAGSGTGATITGNASNFTVGGLQLTNAGSGYTGTPTFTFGGSAATVTPTLSSVALATNSSIGGTGDITINAVVSGSSKALTKVGAGTLTLAGANTYTGATTVSNGKLIVNGNISTSSLTTVQTGATLGGTGSVGAVMVNSGAFHTPGNSPGIQPTGNYSNAGTLGIEINGTGVGTDYDQVNTTGSVSLSGLLSVTMGYTPAANALFFILANDSTDAITGTFSNAPTDGGTYTLGGQQFQISYFGNQTSPGVGTFTGGNDVVLMAIPEPNIAALLGGFGMLALLRRRR